MKTSAASTTRLLPAPSQNGGRLQPLEQAVARQGIPTGFGCSEETVRALTALLIGISGQTLCGDAMYLGMLQAKSLALENGVTEKEFDRVAKLVLVDWRRKRSQNPLSGMF